MPPTDRRSEATVLVLGNPAWDSPFNAAGEAADACNGRTLAVETPDGTLRVRLVGDGRVPLVWHDDADDRNPLTALGYGLRAIDAYRPDAVLTLGRARLGLWYRVETVARNQNAVATTPDARGEVRNPGLAVGAPGHYPRFHHGDTARNLPVTAPVVAMVAAISELGNTCVQSRNPGLFVCEDLLFGLLHHAAAGGFAHPVRSIGALHVPRFEEDARGPAQEGIERAVLAAIEAMARAL